MTDFAPIPRSSRAVHDRFLRPVRDLRLSVMDRCNFRCPYCMPAEVFGPGHAFLPPNQLLRFDEIERLVRAFVALGVNKLRLTGGEPLLRGDIVEIVRRLAPIPGLDDLALTTNATRLAALAGPLAAAGLQRVNVSLDALNEDIFARMSGGRRGVAMVLAGIDAAEKAGLEVKINAVIRRDVNEGEVLPMARYFRGRALALRFIEFMDVGNENGWDPSLVVPSDEIRRSIEREAALIPVAPAAGGEVARRFRYADGEAEVGFISSVTRPFCGDCVRARVSADGKLFTCLFATEGHDLRRWLGGGVSEEQRIDRLRELWSRRADRYSELRAELRSGKPMASKVEMSYIGG